MTTDYDPPDATTEPGTTGLGDALQRGCFVDLDRNGVGHVTSMLIRDAAPAPDGGLYLVLDAMTGRRGGLWVTAAMMAAAEEKGSGWELRYGDFGLRFNFMSEPS